MMAQPDWVHRMVLVDSKFLKWTSGRTGKAELCPFCHLSTSNMLYSPHENRAENHTTTQHPIRQYGRNAGSAGTAGQPPRLPYQHHHSCNTRWPKLSLSHA